jgi:hypothetical protein
VRINRSRRMDMTSRIQGGGLQAERCTPPAVASEPLHHGGTVTLRTRRDRGAPQCRRCPSGHATRP